MATTTSASTGIEALHRLKSTDPPLYLTPSPDLSKAARKALEHLFSSLKPYTPKSPFDRLLVEDEFDAEQIWQQIDLQSQPLISGIRRQVNKFENNPEELSKILKDGENYYGEKREVGLEGERENEAEEDVDDDDADDDEEEEEDDEVEDEEIEDEETEGGGGLEDKFLNIEEMKKFMEDDEAREYGLDQKKPGNNEVSEKYDDDNEEEEGEEEENDDDDDGLGVLELTGEEETSDVENARYEDFFVAKKKENQKKKPKVIEEAEEFNIDNNEKGEDTDIGDGSDVMESDGKTKMDNLSTYEKLLLEQRAKIKEVERENLKAKLWTMQGEVTAAKRPKNSALEVDLDWERNAKPPPVITEQVSHSIEELILKRISEGHFDDVQRVASLPSKAPREAKELDENKSKKGLGDMYADEYAQKTGLVSQALSFSDEQKKEASLLFKKLCLKLDALSHFHFTPKPVIEDMSVQTNVPALAMEEIAPLAVSDAAMLAPEEVFSGKGDIKEEAELTQAERKRRRANKKRKFKAENADRMMAKKARESTLPNSDGNKES